MLKPLIFATLAVGTFSLAASAQESTPCKPKYDNFTYEACQSNEVDHYESGSTTHELVIGSTKDTSQASMNQAGANHAPAVHPEARNQRATNCHAEDHTGDVIIGSLRISDDSKSVYCDYTYEAPKFKIQPGPNCAVASLEDSVGCYKVQHPVLNLETLSECARSHAPTDVEQWVKGVCLMDLFNVDQQTHQLSEGDRARLYKQIKWTWHITNLQPQVLYKLIERLRPAMQTVNPSFEDPPVPQ